MRGGLGDSRAELPRLTDSNHSTVSTPMLEPGMAGWARKSREGGSASLEGKQGLTGSALAAHEKELGVPPLPPGPPSDDGSSLKSLEYHSEVCP